MWIMHFKRLLFIEDVLAYVKQTLQKATNCEIEVMGLPAFCPFSPCMLEIFYNEKLLF